MVYAVPADGPVVPGDPDGWSPVESWLSVFEDCYGTGRADPSPEAAMITGWTDGVSGEPVAAPAMAEWADTVTARIAALHPRRVLEVGAGTGLLMTRLLGPGLGDNIEEYVATDFSAEAVGMLTELAVRSVRATVAVHRAEAAAPVPPSRRGGYDIAVLNSVAQYFPSTAYLERALFEVLAVLTPPAHIVLGDLRSHPLLPARACLRQHRRAPAGTPPGRIAELVARDLDGDGELSLAPAYLHALPARFGAVTAVETVPKRGLTPTEMTVFRYDAVLHVGCPAPGPDPAWTPGAGLTLDAVRGRLGAARVPFGYERVPNARLTEALRLAARHGYGAAARDGVDPEELCRLVERHGWRPRLRWSPDGAAGEFDVWCEPPGSAPGHYRVGVPGAPSAAATVQPAVPPGVGATMKAELLEFLAEKLPDRPLPADVVFTTKLP